MKKLFIAIDLLITYISAKTIILFSIYDKKILINSKWFKGGRYGSFTASGWKMVVSDFKSCRLKNVNRDVPWPVSSDIRIICPENISFHPDDLNNFQGFGNYYQAIGKITIGKGCYIAPNVGIITVNHSLKDISKHSTPKPVTLGARCWIGMNSTILPGVCLGDDTIVAAGSIVTKSFPEGSCVVAGNPAKIIKVLGNNNEEKLEKDIPGRS